MRKIDRNIKYFWHNALKSWGYVIDALISESKRRGPHVVKIQNHSMRKSFAFVLILSFFLFSCRPEENPDKTHLNPPSWLWGAWATDSAPGPAYIFTADNLIHKEKDWNRTINDFSGHHDDLTITEDSFSNHYWLDIDWGGAENGFSPRGAFYRFKKIDSVTISTVEYDILVNDTITKKYFRQ